MLSVLGVKESAQVSVKEPHHTSISLRLSTTIYYATNPLYNEHYILLVIPLLCDTLVIMLYGSACSPGNTKCGLYFSIGGTVLVLIILSSSLGVVCFLTKEIRALDLNSIS